MQNNCIKNLLNFKEVVIKNIKNLKDSVEVYAELLISEQTCPCCNTKTSKIHDHYVQPIKDIPIHLKPTTIFLRKTRYECPSCGKSFYPSNEVVARYNRKSTRFVGYIVDQLRKIYLLPISLKALISILASFLKCYLIFFCFYFFFASRSLY